MSSLLFCFSGAADADMLMLASFGTSAGDDYGLECGGGDYDDEMVLVFVVVVAAAATVMIMCIFVSIAAVLG